MTTMTISIATNNTIIIILRRPAPLRSAGRPPALIHRAFAVPGGCSPFYFPDCFSNCFGVTTTITRQGIPNSYLHSGAPEVPKVLDPVHLRQLAALRGRCARESRTRVGASRLHLI